MKRYKMLKLPHGWFKGKLKEVDVIDTIDATIMYWHTLIVEEVSNTELIKAEREREFLSRMTRMLLKPSMVMA